MATRILDILISLFGLLMLMLMLPVVALLIKVDSLGPIFYRCNRVGKGGRLFKMYKFRTMYETPKDLGPSVSPQGDPRVTPVGGFLRRTKLNEFPQFINVFKGDMTLIGPRPEAPDLAAAYPETAGKIFSVKPGLAGPNQILGRNEEEFYPPGFDPVKYYIEHILPKKLPLDLEYIADRSTFKSLKYLFLSVKVTITGAISRRHLLDHSTQIYMMLADIALCLLSFSLAHYLRYETLLNPRGMSEYFYYVLPWVIMIRLPVFIYFGFYHTLVRHISFYDVKMVAKGVTVSSFLLVSFAFLFGVAKLGDYPRGVFLIDWFCLTNLLIGYRVLLKKLYLRYATPFQGERKLVLIWGAGDAGELCLSYLKKDKTVNYEVVGFIDDAPLKRNRRLNGIKVLGNRDHMAILAKLHRIQEVFVAMPSAPEMELSLALETCRRHGLEAKLFQLNAMDYPHKTLSNHLPPENGINYASKIRQTTSIAD